MINEATPRPWAWIAEQDSDKFEVIRLDHENPGFCNVVASELSINDARLIVRAVNRGHTFEAMREALRGMLEMLDLTKSHGLDGINIVWRSGIEEEARAALALAEKEE